MISALLVALAALGGSSAPVPRTDSSVRAAQATEATFDHEFASWSGLLTRHVQGSRLDYRGVQRERKVLDGALAELHAVTPEQLSSFSRDQRFAFWINVYNTHVVQLILDNYPLASINALSTEAESIWKKAWIPMPALNVDAPGEPLSLDQVEHAILRPQFKDPRVHVAVNCASASCPPLADRAFTAKNLDALLDRSMRAFLADTSRNRFDSKQRTAAVSQIFSWFRSDFETGGKTLGDYLARYAPKSAGAWLPQAELTFQDYDWSLNDVKRGI